MFRAKSLGRLADRGSILRTGNPSNTIYLASAPDATWLGVHGLSVFGV